MQNYKKDGYIIVKNFFDKTELDSIRSDAETIFKFQLKKMGLDYSNESLFTLFKENTDTFKNCGKHIQHLITLHRLSLNKVITLKLWELGMEFPTICTRPVLYFNHPKLAEKEMYHKYPAHQDWPSMQGSSDAIVLWVPLVDIDKDLGSLEVIPGSHLDGDISKSFSDGFAWVDGNDNDFVKVELKKGDALFFNSFLVHKSGNNITDDIRWSCHFRYNNMADSDFIDRKYPHPYIYKSVGVSNG